HALGPVIYRHCIWLQTTITQYHWPGCTTYSKELQQQNKCSSCAGQTISISWTTWRNCTRRCGKCGSPGRTKCGQLQNSAQGSRLRYLYVALRFATWMRHWGTKSTRSDFWPVTWKFSSASAESK